MDATQMISDSFLESDEEENEEENENKRGRPVAKLCILKNKHVPETELPLFLGDNVLGRDPNTCAVPLPSPSISKHHATISISVYRRKGRHSEVDMEALIWDLGSMNGTRKGRLKLTPNVRYALGECDSLVLADIPCRYVSCAEHTEASQEDFKTPVSRASGEKGAGNKKCVYGSTEARVSSSDLEDTRDTPVRSSCLSFEKTPTQPQGTLVPESDPDSDGDGEGRVDRRRKAGVSDSDSYKSSPACSTFLSPTNIIVPESEDESPVTPSLSTNRKPHRHVAFSKEETGRDVGQMQLKEKKAVGDSEGEEGRAGERAALGGRESTESGQDLLLKQGLHVGLGEEDELPVSTTALADVIPAFDIHSDSDMEGEEKAVTPAVPVTPTANHQADQPANMARFHMDSDTDVDEDDEALDKVPKSEPSSPETPSNLKPLHLNPVVQPEAIATDSDTDVDDDDDAAASGAASEANPVSLQSAHTADSALSTQQKDLHLDSDTDVDEDEEKEHGTVHTCSKVDEPGPVTPRRLHLDSDTDDEAAPAPDVSEPPVVSAVTQSCSTADTGADLDILSDSDADVQDDGTPAATTTVPFAPDPVAGVLQSDSDSDTDVDESRMPPAEEQVDQADLHVRSDKDVAGKGVDFARANEGKIPALSREITPGLLAPLLQNCSTPVQMSEEVNDLDNQTNSSADRFRDNREDEDWVEAETQSFVLARDRQGNPLVDRTVDSTQAFCLESSGDEKGEQSGRGGSFQLGLSDSSHLQGQAKALAMESTQSFISEQDTQQYVAISKADLNLSENYSNMAATRVYGEDEEHARCSETSKNEDQVDFAQEATQAYISEPYCDSEDEVGDDERKNLATAETQLLNIPTSAPLAFAETQPMPALEEGESLDEENPASSVKQVKSRPQNHTKDTEEQGAIQPQERPLSEALSVAETQPMHVSDNEERDDENFGPDPQKRKETQLQLEDEQTQPITSSELALVETQPMTVSGCIDGDKEDTTPGARKRKAKQRWVKQEDTQSLVNSALSAVETQPMDATEDGESDEEDSAPGPRKSKAKQLHFEDEQTQSLIGSEVSAVETQPMVIDEDGKSKEDSTPGLRKRKAKPLQIQEEEKPPLSNPEATNETLPLEANGGQSEAGTSEIAIRGERGTRAQLREKEEQAKCSDPPKKQTKNKDKTLRVRKSKSDESESEEVEEVVQIKRARRKKSMKQQKDEENKDSERPEHPENVSVMKEQERMQEDEGLTERTEKKKREFDEREKKREESQRAEQEKLERERKEKEEQESLQLEKAELLRLELERTTKETMERERREQEEKERADRMQKDTESLEREEDENGKLEGDEAPARSCRSARRTTAASRTAAQKQESTPATSDDVPARRTRSRSNSSNSVNSERSASSVISQESRGRGRGRGARRTSESSQSAMARRSSRRRTVATEATEQSSNDASPQALRLRSNSNTLGPDVSSCSSQSRGRGGRPQERGRKTEPCSIPPINSQRDQNAVPALAARGRVSRKTEESSSKEPHENSEAKQGSQQACTTRGRWWANVNDAEDDGSSLNQEEGSPQPKRNVRGRGQNAVKCETLEAPVSHAVSDGGEAAEKPKGRKRELEENTEEGPTSRSKVSKWRERAQTTDAAEEEAVDAVPTQTPRKGRISSIQGKRNTKDSRSEAQVKEENVKMEEVAEKRGRGRPSAAEKTKKEEQETSTSSASRKRQAPADSSPAPKTPRPSSASPAASGRLRAASQTYKVLFTGVVDDAGEKVLARLGGSMARGVADMNCLVTDKVRRTVKFLCAVAKGVPILTTNWLEKSGKVGSFLSPDAFIVKDPEQEKKFNFCLQESLRIASSQRLLQGYEIHVTKSVKPEPPHMKDILTCSGATFLSKMPSSNKPRTVVVSCEEDLQLCGLAFSASLPVVTAEFILTGILQQKLDFQTHSLSAPPSKPQPAGGRGRGRKRT